MSGARAEDKCEKTAQDSLVREVKHMMFALKHSLVYHACFRLFKSTQVTFNLLK
jgi:hypothetical protein